MEKIIINVTAKNKVGQLKYIQDGTIYFTLPEEFSFDWNREKLKKAISELENKNAATTKKWVFELILSETYKKTSEDLGDLLSHYDSDPTIKSTLEDGVNFICGSMFDADIKADIKTELE